MVNRPSRNRLHIYKHFATTEQRQCSTALVARGAEGHEIAKDSLLSNEAISEEQQNLKIMDEHQERMANSSISAAAKGAGSLAAKNKWNCNREVG